MREAEGAGKVGRDGACLGEDAEGLSAKHLVAPPAHRIRARGYQRQRYRLWGVKVGYLPGSFQYQRAASVVDETRIRRPSQPAQYDVGFVPRAANRVVSDPVRFELMGWNLQNV